MPTTYKSNPWNKCAETATTTVSIQDGNHIMIQRTIADKFGYSAAFNLRGEKFLLQGELHDYRAVRV